MKALKKALFFAIFSFFSHTVFAQVSLCNSVYTFLKKNGCKPSTQSLVSTGTNSFPYNISAEFTGKHISEDEYFLNQPNLFILFNQEDEPDNQEVFLPLINYLKNAELSFNVNLVFLYGEKQLAAKEGIVYGSDIFLSSLNTNEDSTVIIVNLNQNESSIVSTTSGKTAPSWLIKNEHDLFKKEKLSHGLPIYYISQLYSYTFKQERLLDSFFSYEIPAVILNFGKEIQSKSTISDILINSIELFSKTKNRNWEQHFLMISIFGHYFTLSETSTVKIIVCTILICLIFLSIIGFLHKNSQFDAWNKIKKIWFVAPITFILILAACFSTKGLCILFAKNFQPVAKLFLFLGSIILFSFLYISIYYSFQVSFNHYFKSDLLDFIIIVTIFINQFIFTIYDISLFPVFLIIVILSIISNYIKNYISRILIYFLMFLPALIYIYSLVNTYESTELYNYFISNNITYIFISLLLYPAFLIYLRVLGNIKEYFQSVKVFYISCTVIFVFVLITIIIIFNLWGKKLNKKVEIKSNTTLFVPEDENSIQISYSDKYVFDDLIRTVNISFTKPCYQCDVRIVSNETPILYSSDSFEQLNTSTAYFKIPNNPPEKMTFSYGTSNAQSQINITAIFQTNDLDQFSLATKSITIN